MQGELGPGRAIVYDTVRGDCWKAGVTPVLTTGWPPTTQAFIEMNTEEAANTMVNYYTSVTPVLRGQPIYIQFSNHKELKTDSSPNQAVRGGA